MLSANSSGKEASKAAIGDQEGALRMDVVAEARKILEQQAANKSLPNWLAAPEPKAFRVTFSPYVILTPDERGQAKVYVLIKAALFDDGGFEKWWTRYIYTLPGNRPISAADSWLAEAEVMTYLYNDHPMADQALGAVMPEFARLWGVPYDPKNLQVVKLGKPIEDKDGYLIGITPTTDLVLAAWVNSLNLTTKFSMGAHWPPALRLE